MLKAFKILGSPAVPMHMAFHAIPLNIAVKYKIPLIIWGENSALEYGGSSNRLKGSRMDSAWRKKFGNYYNLNLKKWFKKSLKLKDLNIYTIPNSKKIKNTNINEIFLGHFF